MKFVTAICALAMSVPAMADFVQPLKANPVSCTAVTPEGDEFWLQIVTNKDAQLSTTVTMQISEVTPMTFKAPPFTIGSEGNIYIQQVDNRAQYNLILEGKEVDALAEDVLDGKVKSTPYTLKGTVSIVHLKNAKVTCKAKLSL